MQSKKQVIFLIGIQGSGKSVQAKLLQKALDADYLNLGSKLRSSSSPLLQKLLKAGSLVPDRFVYTIIKRFFKKSNKNIIIVDGFFRNAPEVKWLAKNSRKLNIEKLQIIKLNLSKNEATKRLIARSSQVGRSDDNPSSIEKRIQTYQKNIDSIVSQLDLYYPNILIQIDASPDIQTIHKNIKEAI